MPRLSGIEVLRRIRERSAVPVLALTARGDNVDKIVGLNMGADDYVAKPCTPAELVARIRAILRRTETRAAAEPSSAPRVLKAGELRLWPGSRRATWHGEPLELTGTEFSLLEVLASHVGKLVSKQDISLQAFDRSLYVLTVVSTCTSVPSGRSWGPARTANPGFRSVRGLGYQLLEG